MTFEQRWGGREEGREVGREGGRERAGEEGRAYAHREHTSVKAQGRSWNQSRDNGMAREAGSHW